MTDSSLCLNCCGWYHDWLCFMIALLKLENRTIKIWSPNFWPSNHYSHVLQTASNQNLQKLLKLELSIMRYCNLKIVYNKTSVKTTVLQNCTGKKKHSLANKTTPKTNGKSNVPSNLIVTKPHLGKVCIFLPILL